MGNAPWCGWLAGAAAGNIADAVCFKPDSRPRMFFRWHVCHRGVWSLLKRVLADFAAADLVHLTRVIKRKLKKIQYRPHLITSCLPPTGLDLTGLIDTPDITDST
ncbi:hypothetical protein [Streptomyces spectabilis]|uniref:Transposase n=1 Tax=Streptomyces spectabilis TaxID=68270 RepID=A0A7W8EZE2_STRST|nr:hypothetical protein [Streptomyces spectabilis]MBB5109826.1 hypothetical protein [Streptomyces spectabilis]GGV56751.1 hypothetical protein GCM10010245_89750 [Streptomyces spectabilis]